MKAVVMAGGEGSRLRPLTANRPKPLVPIANTPIMEHILRLLKEHGVDETVVTLHYLADEIQSYFDDGSDFDMKVEYSIEDTPLGTAGSVKKAEAHLRDGTFFIVSGDALTDCDLSKALAFHREKKSLATLILYRVPNPLEFGVVITDEEGRITRFLEKPSWSEVFSDTVNTGMYILEPEIFETMVDGKNYDWSQDIFPELLREGKPIFGYIMEEYWCDVGNLTQYREAQEHLLSRQTTLHLDGEEVQPGVWVGPHTSIDENAMIMPPVSIGRNCKIKGTAQIGPYTSIGDNTLVEDGAVIERSVVWEGSYIGPNVNISSALVGMKCTIKRDTIVQEEAVIGDRCLVDTNCTIRPRIKLWPDKVIERGSTVTMSLVWGNKWRGNLFRDLGVAGLSNIEITPEFATRLGSAFGSLVPDGSLIVTSRDSTRSSRMIKRAMMASLLSVGCEVMDMRSSPVPVTRHFIRSVGAAGAVNVRKLPGNSRVTLVELFDQRGAYLPKNQERKVETAFFREDFHRVDPDDLGMIGYASRALEEYETDFFKILGPIGEGKRLRIVCDYGFGSISSMFPQMLGRMGIETIGVNGYNDSKLAPRSKDEVARHLSNLRNIVSTLSYDFGVLFTNEGERLTIVDQRGNIVSENDLLALMTTLIAKQTPGAKICLDVTAPQKLRTALEGSGATIVQSKADARSLMDAAIKDTVDFAGDSTGGFIFPVLHPGFDAMFSLAKLINLLQAAHSTPHEIMAELPKFAMAYDTVRCPWEAKGGVMRLLTEKYGETDAELIDGIKVFRDGGWVLILPDSFEQIFHIHAESDTADESQAMVQEFVEEISALQVGIA
ncbi:MAG: NTP transferase domain-containing protein [Armatimonadetes bacterium]|nr:NTP transferase domain-containing protein [Armatimonadota bacterium]